MKDLYYERWALFFKTLKRGDNPDIIDWFDFDAKWVNNNKQYEDYEPYIIINNNERIYITRDIELDLSQYENLKNIKCGNGVIIEIAYSIALGSVISLGSFATLIETTLSV